MFKKPDAARSPGLYHYFYKFCKMAKRKEVEVQERSAVKIHLQKERRKLT